MALTAEQNAYMDKVEKRIARGLTPAEFRLIKTLWDGPRAASDLPVNIRSALRTLERCEIVFYAEHKETLKGEWSIIPNP